MQVLDKRDKNRTEQSRGQSVSHVDGVDQVVLGVSSDVVGGLVDHVHQDGGQVGYQENIPEITTKIY